jgi:chromosomal replication initiation ATPase DnaA
MSLILKNGTLNPVHQERINILQENLSLIEFNNSQGLLRRMAVKQLIEASTELFEISHQLYVECGLDVPSILNVKTIREKVNDFFGVDITKKTRKKEVVYARHATALLCKKFTKTSLQKIAEAVGQTDHTSALHSIRTCMDMMDTDDDYRHQVNTLITYFTQIIHAEENSITTKITTSENY